MAGKRDRSRRNWPTGLHSTVVKGVTYYRYSDPITKRFRGLGTDFSAAKEAALNRNAQISTEPAARYTAKLCNSLSSVGLRHACDVFLEEVQSKKRGRGDNVRSASESTLKDYRGYCQRFCASFGDDKLVSSITLQEIAVYLDSYGDKKRAKKAARQLLSQIWDVAIAKGWCENNLPDKTLKVSAHVRRKRLTIAQYESMIGYDSIDPWFRAAMKLALYFDQRRKDLAKLPVAAWEDGVLVFEEDDSPQVMNKTLTAKQSKTGNIVHITAGPRLREAVEECLALPPRNAQTIIRKPGRMGAVSDDMLTRGFADIRDALIKAKHDAWLGFKPDSDNKPTWHELRSLGAHLAEQAKKDSKNLAGHASEEMHRLYQDGHAKVFEAESL